MKKFVSLLTLIAIVMTIPLGAAGAEDAGLTETATTPEELEEMIDAHVQATIDELTAGYDALVDEIDTYDKYIENTDRIEDFYDSVLSATEALCIDLRAYSVDYARMILASDKDNDDKYDELEDWIYDVIYDDACDEVKDSIYDDLFDDIQDAFYDGVIEDAKDDIPYSEWLDVHSDEYGNWLGTHSDVYGEWLDCHSDIYGFWLNLRSKVYQDDIEGAQDEADDFLRDVERQADRTGHSVTWHVAAASDGGDASGAGRGDVTIPEDEAPAPTEAAAASDAEHATPAMTTAELEEIIDADVQATIDELTAGYDALVDEIDTYDKYIENTDKVEDFYDSVVSATETLCIDLRMYSIDYARLVLASDGDSDDKYDDMDGIYDAIYDDAGDEVYDEIYDGILDEMYDAFYDGVIDDAYDDVPYSDWSDARSDAYSDWSDARSDVYSEWSDFRSDIYGLWSDVRSELYRDDIDGAWEETDDFREDVERLEAKAGLSTGDVSAAPQESDVTGAGKGDAAAHGEAEVTEAPATTEVPSFKLPIAPPSPTQEVPASDAGNAPDGLVDGMRPEFKAAMDSYEAFFDEYVEFLKSFANNPSDLSMLAQYADMISEAEEMEESFEAWDEDDMNSKELSYYLEVTARVLQKLSELGQ